MRRYATGSAMYAQTASTLRRRLWWMLALAVAFTVGEWFLIPSSQAPLPVFVNAATWAVFLAAGVWRNHWALRRLREGTSRSLAVNDDAIVMDGHLIPWSEVVDVHIRDRHRDYWHGVMVFTARPAQVTLTVETTDGVRTSMNVDEFLPRPALDNALADVYLTANAHGLTTAGNPLARDQHLRHS